MARLVFYHFYPSAPSRAALLTLRSLGLDAEIKIVDLFKKEQLNKNYIEKNPQHCVPTIDDNGFIVWESGAISMYLVDSKAPGHSLYPSDIRKRAIINQRLFFNTNLYERIRSVMRPIIVGTSTTVDETKRKEMYEAFELLNTFLEGQSYVSGDTLTIADLAILSSISTPLSVGTSIEKYQNLYAWYDRMKSVPGYEENAEGAKQFGEKFKANADPGTLV